MKLSSKSRNALPASKFAGPGRSFPVQDKSHARAAISGATRSQNAGNISASTASAVKAKARSVLNEGSTMKKVPAAFKDYQKGGKGKVAGPPVMANKPAPSSPSYIDTFAQKYGNGMNPGRAK